MSESCSIQMCKNLSRTQCHCCRNNFCRSHFVEHDNLPNLQLNSLVDEINSLQDRLTTLDVHKLARDSRQKLEQWRIRCYKTIDDIFEAKCREIDQRANEKVDLQRENISKIQSTVAEFLRKQETNMKDIDLLEATIHTVDKKMHSLEQTSFEIIARPLIIDDSFIRIEEFYLPQLDSSLLSARYKTIDHFGDSSGVIASNAQCFLIHQAPNLSLLDRELTVIKTSQWNNGLIWDMCWSRILSSFFVLTETKLFQVHDDTLHIERIQINQNKQWCSCTCSDTTLFLCTSGVDSSILQVNLFPSVQFGMQWKSVEIDSKYQMITNMVYHHGTLALMLLDSSKKEKIMELRSSTTFERLWSLKLDIDYKASISRCCFLDHGNWLVWDYGTSHILHITKDGKLQTTSTYNAVLVHVILFNRNQLAISTTKNINLHKMKSQ